MSIRILYPFSACEVCSTKGDFPERLFSADFADMGVLRDLTKDDFEFGVVLYAGEDVVPFGDRFLAVPFSAPWQ